MATFEDLYEDWHNIRSQMHKMTHVPVDIAMWQSAVGYRMGTLTGTILKLQESGQPYQTELDQLEVLVEDTNRRLFFDIITFGENNE